MTYSRITNEQFDEMQFDAGVWVRSFNIQSPAVQDSDIICATSGGISLSVVPSIVDLGDGVYMMPKGTAEMLMVTGWTVDASFTTLGFGGGMIQFVLGASDSGADGINPRLDLQDGDFEDLWWIGDRVDGGLVAIHLLNALSDEGIDIQTERQASGKISVHLTAHASIEEDMEAVPVEIYSVGTPKFWIEDHIYLYADGIGNDVIEVDTSTGNLNVTENGIWHYVVDEETGTMEVMYK